MAEWATAAENVVEAIEALMSVDISMLTAEQRAAWEEMMEAAAFAAAVEAGGRGGGGWVGGVRSGSVRAAGIAARKAAVMAERLGEYGIEQRLTELEGLVAALNELTEVLKLVRGGQSERRGERNSERRGTSWALRPGFSG